MMSRIYSLSDGTVSWLGDRPVAISAAVDRDVNRSFHANASEEDYQRYWEESRPFSGNEPHMGRDEYVRYFNGVYHEYWNRIWIIQQVVLPRKNLLLDDHAWLDSAVLRAIAYFLASFYNYQEVIGTSMAWTRREFENVAQYIHSALKTSKVDREPRGWSLSDVFDQSMTHGECELDCDLVYALQGLVMSESRIKIDYGKSNGEVLDDLMDGLCVAGIGYRNRYDPEGQGPVRRLLRLSGRLGMPPRWNSRIVTAATRKRYRSHTYLLDNSKELDRKDEFDERYGLTEQSFADRLVLSLRLGRILCVASLCSSGFNLEDTKGDDEIKQARISRLSPFQRVEITFCLDSELEYLDCSLEEWLSRLDMATESEPLKIHTSQFLTELAPSKEHTYPVHYRSRTPDEVIRAADRHFPELSSGNRVSAPR